MPAPLARAFNRPEPLLYHFEVVHPSDRTQLIQAA